MNISSEHEKELVYQGLKSLIESGSGVGFHNKDLGHPAYVLGAQGKVDPVLGGDGPDQNVLFKLLSTVTKELKESGIEQQRYVWWYDFSTWQNFCKFAVDVYKRKKVEG